MSSKKILIMPYRVDPRLKDLEYLSEGVLEELIYLISSNSKFSTTSRTTGLYLQNNPIPYNEIRDRFNVEYILEGSIITQNGRNRISSRLFKAADEELILNMRTDFEGEKWTVPLDKLVCKITETITGTKSLLPRKKEDASKAREFYQKGRYHWHRYSHEEMKRAIRFFEKSIKENESYALPYAAIADSYSVMGVMGYEEPKKVFKLAKSFMKKALRLNDKRSESYVSAAFLNIFYDRDFERAKINLGQALKLNNKNVNAYHALAMYSVHMGDYSEGEKNSKITLELEPLALPHYAMIARMNLYKKDFDAVSDYLDAASSIGAPPGFLADLRGFIKLFSGNTESAIEHFLIDLETHPEGLLPMANLAFAYSKAGFHKESRSLESRIHDLKIIRNTGLWDFALAIVKLGQSDRKSFYKHIRKAVDSNLGMLPGELVCHPIFDQVRDEPELQGLLKICNLKNHKSGSTKKRKPDSSITIATRTSETQTLDPQDFAFAESDDNYCKIHWFESGVLQNRTLRVTLKEMERQLSDFPFIVRCHKSFLINLNQQHLTLSGNARTLHFESDQLPIRIPVSRAKHGSVKKMFEANKD